jgi:hypothetical protein
VSLDHLRFAGCCSLLACHLLPVAARAQVNAEVLQANPFREGWTGGVDGSVALSRGNIDLLDVGGTLRVQFQTLVPQEATDEETTSEETAPIPFLAQRVSLTGNGRFAERAGAPFISQAFVHLRWTAMWHERVGSDTFAQYQFNAFQRLEARAVAGLGLRIEMVHEPSFLAWAGSGYMFEYDLIDVLPGASDPRDVFEHRWTNYFSMRLAVFDDQLLLQNTLYYQPRFDSFEDFRLLEELEVLATAGESVRLGVTLSVLYDSSPPSGVLHTDLRLVNMLRLAFP